MPWTSLKSALLFNALCSTILGVILLFYPSAVAALMGEFNPLILMVLGAGLLLFAADVAWVATPVVMILAAPWVSFWGQILLLDVALLVAFCALCQWRGLQRQQLA